MTPEELGGEVFVDFHPDWGPRRATDAVFAAAGVRRTVALEVNDVHSLLELVDENLGVAVVPRHFRHKRDSLIALARQGHRRDRVRDGGPAAAPAGHQSGGASADGTPRPTGRLSPDQSVSGAHRWSEVAYV